MEQPHFRVVCDHGIRDGRLDHVAWLVWCPDIRQWRPGPDYDDAIETKLIDYVGRNTLEHTYTPDLQQPRSRTRPPKPPGPARSTLMIPCPTRGCTRRQYRTDRDKLQTLFEFIASNQQFRDAVSVVADENVIVIKLDALHTARDTACTRFHLEV